MDRDVAGVRISPASVTFYDTVPENVEQLNVTVYNISKSSKSIRFYAPKTKVGHCYLSALLLHVIKLNNVFSSSV